MGPPLTIQVQKNHFKPTIQVSETIVPVYSDIHGQNALLV